MPFSSAFRILPDCFPGGSPYLQIILNRAQCASAHRPSIPTLFSQSPRLLSLSALPPSNVLFREPPPAEVIFRKVADMLKNMNFGKKQQIKLGSSLYAVLLTM
jgi:hypothetical protein